MFCPKCGKQIDDDSVFCEYCGENVEETPAADPFQTVYADDSADYNNDYTDNYADNYADDYNNAYPANFTEPEPMPSPAPEKSGKKMIAAVCAVCSVMLVLMAVLCAKFIFGGKKIQTDDQSANSLAAAVTTAAADSSSVVAEESSAAETAVTTAATTAPAAESSSSKAENEKKKKQLSGIDLKKMTIAEIRDYVGDDYSVTYEKYREAGSNELVIGITSEKYFRNIIIGSYTFSTHVSGYLETTLDKIPSYSDEADYCFNSGNYDYEYPDVIVFEDGSIGLDLYNDPIKAGCNYKSIFSKIETLGGVNIYGISPSVIQGTNVNLSTNDMDVMRNYDDIRYSQGDNIIVYRAYILDKIDLKGTLQSKITKNNAPLMNATYDYDSKNPLSAILIYLNKGETVYVDSNSIVDDDDWYRVYYKWETDSGAQWKAGYMRSEYVDWS